MAVSPNNSIAVARAKALLKKRDEAAAAVVGSGVTWRRPATRSPNIDDRRGEFAGQPERLAAAREASRLRLEANARLMEQQARDARNSVDARRRGLYLTMGPQRAANNPIVMPQLASPSTPNANRTVITEAMKRKAAGSAAWLDASIQRTYRLAARRHPGARRPPTTQRDSRPDPR